MLLARLPRLLGFHTYATGLCWLRYVCAAVLMLVLAMGAKAQSIQVPEVVSFADQTLTLSQADKDSIARWAEPLTRNNKYLRSYVDRADAFMPIVERILAEEQAPEDLKYIVLVESSLTSDLVSKSNAVGYWQFKYATATDFQLRCDSLVDERKSIVSSTRAAARYLKNSNRILDNWIFSTISYYQGLTGAKTLLGTSLIGAKEFTLEQLAHKYAYKVLAHKLVFQDLLYRNGMPLLQVHEYKDCGGQSLTSIAERAGIEYAKLREFNKWIRLDTVPTDKPYTVIIPSTSENRHLVLAMLDKPVAGISQNLEPYEGKKVFFNLITIKDPALDTAGKGADYKSQIPLFFNWNGLKAIMARPGDNINKLALQGGIDRDDFLEYNDMKVFDLIGVGQVYYLEAKRRKGKVPYHIVSRDGETMWEISQNYGVRLKHLLRKNRMDKPEVLKAGRVIYLRRDRGANEPVEYKPVPKTNVLSAFAPTPVIQQLEATKPNLPARANTARKPIAPALPPEQKQEQKLEQQPGQPRPADAKPAETKPAEVKPVPQPEKPAPKTVQPQPPVAKPEVKPEPKEEPAASPYANMQGQLVLDAADTTADEDPVPNDDLPVATTPVEKVVPSLEPVKPGVPQPAQPVAPTKAPEVMVVQPVAQQQAPKELPKDTTQPGAKLPPVPKYMLYTLQGGETLYGVAEKLQIPLDSIISWNLITENTILKPGVVLKFRPAQDLKFEAEQALKAKAEKQAKTVVKEQISTPPVPKSAEKQVEKPADKPVAPAVTPVPAEKAPEKPKDLPKETTAPAKPGATNSAPAGTPTYHTVAAGETAYRICRQYGISLQQLLDWNGKSNATLSAGERVIVKKP